MSDLTQSILTISEDLSVLTDNYDKIYDDYFKADFDKVDRLYLRCQSIKSPITDDELEEILTSLPLDLFNAAEKLNRLRLSQQVIKLKCKTGEIEGDAKSEYDIVSAVYASVIERVENQISFSRELIMGAKKIWDSRRHTEKTNPVSPIKGNDLPVYGERVTAKSPFEEY